MSKLLEVGGSCLCGAVHFFAKAVKLNVGACHCSTCRQWSGGPFFAAECGTDVLFENAEKISIFNSSEWAERGFCQTCGTHLFYRLRESQQYFIPVGLFTSNEGFVLNHQIFIDEKPGFYSFANKTYDMTGTQFFAKFSGSTE